VAIVSEARQARASLKIPITLDACIPPSTEADVKPSSSRQARRRREARAEAQDTDGQVFVKDIGGKILTCGFVPHMTILKLKALVVNRRGSGNVADVRLRFGGYDLQDEKTLVRQSLFCT